MTDKKKPSIPYSLQEAQQLVAYHGAPATKCPLDDDRFLATVEELERLRQALNNIKKVADHTIYEDTAGELLHAVIDNIY